MPPEVWLRSPIEGILDQLQPAAHALPQSTEDIEKYRHDFRKNRLWEKPSGRASIGFHQQHITEVGRKRLPTTVIGLLFATEHSQRHVGQLLVTASVLADADAV